LEQPDVEATLVNELARSRGVNRDAILRELARGDPIDSLEGLELAIAAEMAFGITMSDHELSSGICRSIRGLARVVCAKLAQQREREEASG
jgi:acyl carrier protein